MRASVRDRALPAIPLALGSTQRLPMLTKLTALSLLGLLLNPAVASADTVGSLEFMAGFANKASSDPGGEGDLATTLGISGCRTRSGR